MCVTSESDEKIMPNNDVDSPATDDAESESITTVGESSRLKKGPWTAAEDAILVEYVTRKGEGNWNAVQRHTGLARCGKSCRLRWANHLRPDLKKGAFTEEEEKLIVELHAKMGNKWARMAAEMPGRTDNEIKNYWNTRIKRRQRAGLPLYPPELRLQTLNENQHNDTMSSLSSDSREAAIPINNFEIPSIQFKNLELNQPVYPPPFLDLPTNNFPLHGLHSSYPEKFELPIIHPPKRLRGSEPLFPNHPHSLTFNHSQPPFTYYDPHGLTFNNNHADLNGNPSSSSSKEEQLPSLQTQIQKWCSSSPHLPLLESCDNLIRTPPILSHQLDAMNMMHGSQNMNNFKNSSNDSGMVFNYASSELINEAGWEPYGELTSSLGHSSSSMFSDGIATPISRNSISEHEGVEGFRANEELPIWAPSQHTTGWEDLPIPSDYYTREKQP